MIKLKNIILLCLLLGIIIVIIDITKKYAMKKCFYKEQIKYKKNEINNDLFPHSNTEEKVSKIFSDMFN